MVGAITQLELKQLTPDRAMNMRYEDAVQGGGPRKELFQYMICLQRKELCDTEGGYLDMPNLIFDMVCRAMGQTPTTA